MVFADCEYVHANIFDRYFHEIQLANGIFLEDTFNLNPTYKKLAQDVYGSEVEKLSFSVQPVEATKRINEWINQNTHGKIPEIFPLPVGSNTVMVIASALYFKALWEDMFIEGATRPRDFFPDGRNNSPIKIDMMAHGGCFPYYDSSELDARILGIPYKNKLTTMYVIKPTNSNRRSLQELIAKLNSVTIDGLINRMKRKTALILFPKMHLSSTLNLKKVLKILGVRSLFSAQKSDLSVISGDSTQIAINPFTPENPTVNLPIYPNKKKPAHNNDKLVFSRFENETTADQTMADETYAPTTMMPPTTIEQDMTDPTEPVASTVSPSVQNKGRRIGRDVSYKTPTDGKGKPEPLNSKDFFLNKRIVKPTLGKKSHRSRREAESLYVSDAIHKVDLEINERGTEGGAATAITLNRSGTNVVFRADEPFLLLIRNDKTKVPLFFGAIYDPSP